MDDAVDALVHRLARAHPQAMARLKQVFWEGTDHWDTLLADRAAMSGTLVLSDYARRAIGAFGKKG
jgi:methylglutaconyl-CoA hydratase